MKKLFSILFMLSVLVSTAQVITMPLSSPTLTNASVVTATYQVKNAYQNVSIQAVATKSTGTVAGTVQVSASVDGVNYVALTTSSLALTDVASQNAVFPLTYNNYLYYKVTFTGTGTQVFTPAAYLFVNHSGENRNAVAMINGTVTAPSTTNTATSFVSYELTQWYNTVTIQSVVTKVSGTVAGTVTLQGSLDGVNYSTVSASYVDAVNYVPTDQATNTKIFMITGSPYRFYRLSYTGAGTMSATHQGYVLPNRR